MHSKWNPIPYIVHSFWPEPYSAIWEASQIPVRILRTVIILDGASLTKTVPLSEINLSLSKKLSMNMSNRQTGERSSWWYGMSVEAFLTVEWLVFLLKRLFISQACHSLSDHSSCPILSCLLCHTGYSDCVCVCVCVIAASAVLRWSSRKTQLWVYSIFRNQDIDLGTTL